MGIGHVAPRTVGFLGRDAQIGTRVADGATVLGGLLLASISTVLVQSALFQRKSRSGWLDELDEIREGALRDGEIDDGVSVSDIWTDLRDGGSYEDPHEISGLYASDDTPDAPGPKEPPRRKEKAKGRAKGKDREDLDQTGSPMPEPMVAPTLARTTPTFPWRIR